MIPVKDNKGLFRDEKTNSIINCDDLQYNQYLKMKELNLKKNNEIDELKMELKEMKKTLKYVLERINK